MNEQQLQEYYDCIGDAPIEVQEEIMEWLDNGKEQDSE